MNATPTVRQGQPSFAYEIFGLRLASEVELPELVAIAPAAPPEISVSVRSLPPIDGERVDGFAATSAGVILNVPRAGRYLVRDGCEVIVDPDPAGTAANLRLYLLGSAMGALLHQRGLLPLHANSIAVGGSAIAFLGRSGAGKSTIAAWYHDQGFRVLADDVCVVTMDQATAWAQPGIPRLRLWKDALEASGRVTGDYERSFDDMDKFDVPTRAANQVRALQLAALYVLDPPESGVGRSAIRRLPGAAAVEALVANTYRGNYVARLGGTARHLASCIALAKLVPAFSVERRWGRDQLEGELRELEAHARTLTQQHP
jgi:hypothetical protein